MSDFKVKLVWQRTTDDFNYKTYDRTHTLFFEGGITYKASAAPEYLGNPSFINPEENFIASLSSCHMLTFLAIAAHGGYLVDSYEDNCIAQLSKNEEGKLGVFEAHLYPKTVFSGDKMPNSEELVKMHEKAHKNCFIANSVKTKILFHI